MKKSSLIMVVKESSCSTSNTNLSVLLPGVMPEGGKEATTPVKGP